MRPHVVVVGGGLAGLSAAVAAAGHGARVTLLEKRPRLGGATWSFQRNGLWFDNGQHVFLRCCTAYRSFLDRIGATDRVRLQERLSVPVVGPGTTPAWLRRNGLPAPLHLALALARYHHLDRHDRLRLVRAAVLLGRLDPDDPRLDELTFETWLRRHGQSADAIAGLWNLIALPTLNVPASDAALGLAVRVFRTGLLDDSTAGDLGWSRVPLARLHAPATHAIERTGGRVRVSAGVQRVDASDGLAVRVDGERIAADAVIVAVPHDAAATLLPRGALDDPTRLHELGTSPIVNVHLVYDRRVTELEFAAAIRSPVQWVFDRTEVAELDEGQCLAISLSAADEHIGVPAPQLVSRFTAELARLFPAARDARLVDALVTRERAATFRARPGTRALRPVARTQVPGVVLAGAWTDTGWPATMEGAVRSGNAAAVEAIHATTTRPRRPVEVPA